MASTLVLLLQLLLVSLASASHFFGGTVTFSYKGRNPDGSFKVDVRNRATFDGCQYSHSWNCYSGNCGYDVKSQRGILDRSTNAPQSNRQWCETETVRTKRITNDKPFQMRAASCCWIPTRNSGSSWRLLTHVDLGTRSDTGEPNRSPDIAILPFLRVPQNCPRTYRLMSFDPDGDKVRCRYGNIGGTECNRCTQPSGFHLDQGSCTLHYHYANANPRVYGFELVVEDFPRRPITLAYTDGSRSSRSPLTVRRKRQAFWHSTTTPSPTALWWWWHPTTAAPAATAAPWWWRQQSTTTTVTPAPATTAAPWWWWWHSTTAAPAATAAPWWWRQQSTTTTVTPAPATTAAPWWWWWHSTTAAPATTTAPWWWRQQSTTTTVTPAPATTAAPWWWWWHSTTAAPAAPAPTTPWWSWWHSTPAAPTAPAPTTPWWWWWHSTPAAPTAPAPTTPWWWWWHSTPAAPTAPAPTTPWWWWWHSTPAAPTAPAPTTPWWWWHSTPAAPTTTTPPYTTTTGLPYATTPPLSKLPLQFSLLVDPPAPSCQEGEYLPRFVNPTPQNGERIHAEVNKEVEIRVKAQARYSTIHDIIISGPMNISKHRTTHDEFVIRWTPIPEDLGDHYPICFAVESFTGSAVTASQRTSRHQHHYHPTPSSQSGIYQSDMRCVLVDVKKEEVKTNVICTESTMTVEVEKSSLSGLHEDHLQLSDPTNTACSLQHHSNSTHVIAVIPLNACGTQLEEDEDNLIFKNEITTVDNHRDLITRKHQLEVEFYCQYPKQGNVTLGFTAHRKNVTVWEKGFGTFTYQFEFYQTNQFRTMINPNSYPLEYDVGSRVYMEIEASSSVNNTELFVESCWAAPYDNPNYWPTYSIIENGCNVDETVKIHSTDNRRQFKFCMEAFKFIGMHDQVYISCSVLMCEAGNPNTRCSQGCINSTRSGSHHHHHRKREAVIQSASHFVSQGPLRLRRSAESTENTVTNLNLNLNLVFIAGCLLAAVGMISAVVMYKAKMSKVKYQPLPVFEN
ncbi:uncharacterized protein [Thunnus thynnus]|uniref:uncharacterized protein isoform X2 n=1 Tax=Thunnus thynnus TaxID=8237 RepID=UPI00352731BA